MNSCLGILMGFEFFGSSNCRWQNASSATRAAPVGQLVATAAEAAATEVLLAIALIQYYPVVAYIN